MMHSKPESSSPSRILHQYAQRSSQDGEATKRAGRDCRVPPRGRDSEEQVATKSQSLAAMYAYIAIVYGDKIACCIELATK